MGPLAFNTSLRVAPTLCVATETAGIRPAHADRGRAAHAGGWGLPGAHQTTTDQSWGEGAEEDPQEDQKQGVCEEELGGKRSGCKHRVNSLVSVLFWKGCYLLVKAYTPPQCCFQSFCLFRCVCGRFQHRRAEGRRRSTWTRWRRSKSSWIWILKSQSSSEQRGFTSTPKLFTWNPKKKHGFRPPSDITWRSARLPLVVD